MLIKTYKLKLKSFFLSELHSDTLWGHICWGIKFLYGEEKLEEFLEIYKNAEKEEDFPFIFSSIFPFEKLPIPAIPMQNNTGVKKQADYADLKKAKKIKYLDKEVCSGSYRKFFLSNDLLALMQTQIKDFYTDETLHNVVSRESGTTEDDGLFVREKKFANSNDYWFFVKIGNDDVEKWSEILKSCLDFFNKRGIGADTSVGGGQVEIEEHNFNLNELFDTKNPDSYISFSHCISSKALYYNTITKYGKIYMKLESADEPFKQPIILMEPGAVLQKESKEYLAESVLFDIHKNPKIIQALIPFLMPVSLNI